MLTADIPHAGLSVINILFHDVVFKIKQFNAS